MSVTCLSWFRDLCRTGIRRASGFRRFWRNSTFQTQLGSYTHELTETVTAWVKLLHAQAKQNSNRQKDKWAQNPTPSQETIWNDSIWERENSVYFNGVSLDISATLHVWGKLDPYFFSIFFSKFFKRVKAPSYQWSWIDRKLGGSGRSWESENTIKTYCTKCSKMNTEENMDSVISIL